MNLHTPAWALALLLGAGACASTVNESSSLDEAPAPRHLAQRGGAPGGASRERTVELLWDGFPEQNYIRGEHFTVDRGSNAQATIRAVRAEAVRRECEAVQMLPLERVVWVQCWAWNPPRMPQH